MAAGCYQLQPGPSMPEDSGPELHLAYLEGRTLSLLAGVSVAALCMRAGPQLLLRRLVAKNPAQAALDVLLRHALAHELLRVSVWLLLRHVSLTPSLHRPSSISPMPLRIIFCTSRSSS